MSIVKSISNCLSLRNPQKDALQHLASVVERLHEANLLSKEASLEEQLNIVQDYHRSVGITANKAFGKFDFDFCSLTFDMATGVGKTRLMGAFIAYLYKKYNFRNYLIVAPNTTIYEKLIVDFTPDFSNKKYVFRGLDPLGWETHKLITGDNYNNAITANNFLDETNPITINIFNIAKLTEKGKDHLDKENSQSKVARVRRVSELLGDSYFNMLANTKDLVVIMDEAHHYRASASNAAIADLKPVLGLELTATPDKNTHNILYSYGLPQAMRDGFVKVPAVAYRSNLDLTNFSSDELDHMKLKEADLIHSNKKLALKDYEFNHGIKQNVKPFIFVISRDIAHAKQIEAYTQSSDFCEGKYKGKVLRVDSSSSDEDIKKLLFLENPLNPYEIVIHCNKLGEGWDVTNLYTIVPLRAANEMHLIMQSIGRGLRLPYGKRVGERDVDQVVVISHDNFNKVIEEATKKMGDFEKIDLGSDDSAGTGGGMPRKVPIVMTPKTEILTGGNITASNGPSRESPSMPTTSISVVPGNTNNPMQTPSSSEDDNTSTLSANTVPVTPETAAGRIITRMDEGTDNGQKPNLEDPAYVKETKDVLAGQNIPGPTADKAIDIVKQVTIDIPRITLTPKYRVTCNLDSFVVDGSEIKKLQPVDNKLMVRSVLNKNATAYISKVEENGEEFNETDFMYHLMVEISDMDEIDYDSNAKIVSDIANQTKNILLQCSKPGNIVINYFCRICDIVKAQVLAHRRTGNLEYATHVEPGYVKLQVISGTINEGEKIRDFKDDVFVKSQIKSMAFTGFEKCLYDIQKFDSDPERKLMVEMESDVELLKWFRATQTTFSIPYGADGSCYTPDIIMETKTEKIMCEVKAANKIQDEEVLQKAEAGKRWCESASSNDTKPWVYVLISEEEIKNRESMDISGLKALSSV